MTRIADLFAGIGGIRLGFEQALGKENVDCVFTSEIDKFAVETYKANFGGGNIHRDITKINASDIPDHDILLAGFPCQPFSTAGLKRGFDDSKNGNAYFAIERILIAKRPKVFLLENVKKGLQSADNGEVFRLMKDRLSAIANDHAFSAGYAIASAASKIFVTRTSGVGSIGVIATHADVSEYDKKERIKYTTIFAGDKKNDLSPHEPISDEAISDLQKEVDRLYGMFVAVVARNRNVSSAQVKATRAALYFGADSAAVGLADETAGFRECLQLIGGEMTEDIEAYKAEVSEISKLCKLARAENKLAEFIEQDLRPDQVKEALLAAAGTQNEIVSTVYHKEAAQENPVIAAAKARITGK
jgi:glutamate racemase